MYRCQRQVNDFMNMVGQDIPEKLTIPNNFILRLRHNLIEQESDETLQSLESLLSKESSDRTIDDIVSLIDGLCDSLYVIFGTFTALGLDAEMFFDIVHAANMQKKGGPQNELGKQLKPPKWQGPEAEILMVLRQLGE